MVKRSLLLALSLVLVFTLSTFAGEGSDTVGGGKLLPQLRYGYSASDWDSVEYILAGYRDWDVNTHSYYLQVNWGVLENVELVGLVGGQSLAMDSHRLGARFESDGWAPMFMWGLGVKATFFRADNGLYVGGGALFTHSFSRDFEIDQYNAAGVRVASYDVYMDIYRLTPELHVGWHIGDTGLTPYIGVDYTWLRASSDWVDKANPAFAFDASFHLDDPVYMFVGLDHQVTDRLYLNFEGRTNFSGSDGWGIEGGIGYMFDICPKPAPAPAPEPAPVIEPKLEPMTKN
ncbi:MAG: hypothetical protein JW765_01775 [Deltaproteobacteria bacterium]|nr:hypothetical protein [Candidatus Zymogenaceae bacterium]